MRVTELRLNNFKRFTDLTIADIPETAKLVVVVGPNGAGKSSVFDALNHWYRLTTGFGQINDEKYFRKSEQALFDHINAVQIKLARGESPRKGCFYLRTAYRHEPDFSSGAIQRYQSPADQLRIQRTIDGDATVSENYNRLVYESLTEVYNRANDAMSVGHLRERLIGSVQQSLRAVLGDLTLNSISDPISDTTFYFGKGTTRQYHYKNLSGGEKAAFDLLLDFHIKTRALGDAIYCIDEVETHLHTRVQGRLVQELFRITPERGQLWINTHSLGVIRTAQELSKAQPGSVALIDFDGSDPDQPRVIRPSSIDRVAWEKMLSIALDDLSSFVAPRYMIVCEGSSTGSARKDFDAEIYSRILGTYFPDFKFVSGGSSSQLAATQVSVTDLMTRIVPGTNVFTLYDADDRNESERQAIVQNGGLVLSLRSIESYLLADDVLEAFLASTGQTQMYQATIAARDAALAASIGRGKPADDLKSASGEFYVNLKRVVPLDRTGNTVDAFMKDTLSKHVHPGSPTFERLKADIIDEIHRRGP